MTVYFVSDIHLKPERPDLTRAFSYFLTETAQDASELFLLGDIFEAWIGDDAPIPGLDELFSQLKALSDKGCKIFFQHGNRDFLLGQTFVSSIGAELLPEEILIDLPCGPALIMHGDQLCTDDQEYMQFRAMVRDPQWQSAFKAKSLEERLAIARQLREASKERGAEKSEYITDVNTESVVKALNDNKCDLLIHGHTHRPAIHQIRSAQGPSTRIVLGDWDEKGWYLKVNSSGYELISFEIAEA